MSLLTSLGLLPGFIISTLVVLVAIGVEYMISIAPYGTL